MRYLFPGRGQLVLPRKRIRRRAQPPQHVRQPPVEQRLDRRVESALVKVRLLGHLDPVLERAAVRVQRHTQLHAPLYDVVLGVHSGVVRHDLADVAQRPVGRLAGLLGRRVLEVLL